MSRSARFSSIALGAALVALPLAVTLVGCGSGSGNRAITTVPIGGGTTNLFAGRYVSTLALGSDRSGALDMTIAQSGAVTGTLTVTQPSAGRGKQVFSFALGAYNMVGSVNPSTGAFTVTGGTAPDDFTVTGTLPVPGNNSVGGTYNLAVGGQNYPGTFGTTVPTPTPSPIGTPTPAPSPTASPSSSAVSFTVVSKSADCNVNADALSNLKVTGSSYNAPGSLLYAFTVDMVNPSNANGKFTLNWTRYNGPTSITPESFTFTSTPSIGVFGDDFQGQFSIVIAPTGAMLAGAWTPTGGKLIIESVVGNTVKLRGENVTFTPNAFNAVSAKGLFIANFSITVENVPNL